MKLKQRSLMATVGVAVLVLVAFQTNWFGWLDVPSPLKRHQAWPRLRSRYGERTPYTLRGEAPDIRAHLSIMRKDLDLSAYASLETDTKNLTDSELMELIIKDRNLHNKGTIDGIIRVAHLLESYKNKRIRKPMTYNSPSNSSDVGGPISSVKGNDSPEELPPIVIERLGTIVSAMNKKHQRILMRNTQQLDIYKRYTNSGRELPAWKLFHNHINQFSLYDPADPTIDQLLRDIVSQPIVKLYQHEGGTQLKLVFYLANNARVMWKPRRFPRDRETLPDHFYFNDYERFNAEIAAFHLDRILGFYRVTPTTGRAVNMTHDILRLAERKLSKTFYVSPAGNVCFHGKCSYYCDTNHAVCGSPVLLEGSMAAFLPNSNVVKRKKWIHPWRRSYSKVKLAAWRTDPRYCDAVRAKPPYNTGRRLLDLTDLAIFDFFTGPTNSISCLCHSPVYDLFMPQVPNAISGNLDRHHYETFLGFGNYTSLLHLDNGRGFGKSHYDDLTILAPIIQCCLIRYSTLRRLVGFLQSETTLAERMRQSMTSDKLAPILMESHLLALDRRLNIVLQVVYNCTIKVRVRDVIVDDGF